MSKDTLSIRDNRTEKEYEIPIWEDTIRAMDLRQIKVKDGDFGMMSYDPAFLNTANTKSTVTLVDGGNGILQYRGYPIADLAENASFLEVAYLILFGELPKAGELAKWEAEIKTQMALPEALPNIMKAFPKDAHPMGAFVSNTAALGTLYPDAREVLDEELRWKHIKNLVAKSASLGAYFYRHSQGLGFVDPDEKLSYAGNFLRMMFHEGGGDYTPDPAVERAINILFILHADHEQNCGTTTMRTIGSSQADPYSAAAGAAAALYGPLHGGANEAVLRMLAEIEDVSNIPAFMDSVRSGDKRLMGFGHRVYKNYDPRAKIIKKVAEDVFKVTGRNPLLDIALELEQIALSEDYFIERKLYPNVDFYSGIIYQALGIPVSMFTVMFAIPRMVGWLAQWTEMLGDNEQKIARPRQVFLGPVDKKFVPIEER
ncbi:MAG: citrate synthase [Anaerolineales bacterium]|nr:citrate synthase [Anaerolineales bacterium]